MSGLHSGTFEWEIRPPLLIQMLNSKNGVKYHSVTFKIGKLNFSLVVYPNGYSLKTVGSFIFGLTLEPWPSPNIAEIVICRSQYCKQTQASATCINSFNMNSNSFGWLSRRLLLSELKSMGHNLQYLQIGLSIHILKIEMRPQNLSIYPSQFGNITNIGYAKKQIIEWNVNTAMMKLFKLSYYGKRYESQMTTSNNGIDAQFMMACYPNGYKAEHKGFVAIFIRVCRLPPTVTGLLCQFNIKCLQTNHEWKERHCFKYDDASVGDVKFMTFKQISTFDTVMFTADINVISDESNDIVLMHSDEQKQGGIFKDNQQIELQLKQNKYETDALKYQISYLMKRLNILERKINVISMTPIEEKTEEQSVDKQKKNNNITQITSELLLYRQQIKQVHSQNNEKQNELQKWLHCIGLNQYFNILMENGFDDLDSIKSLTVHELHEIGIRKLGHKKKLMKYIGKLQ